MRIFLEDTFDSAHFLPNVSPGHKCHNLHGHTYGVRIEIEGDIDPVSGWITDYAEIKKIWDGVKKVLDHRCLNDVPGLENSTCERLVEWVWYRLSEKLNMSRLEIRETARCGAVKEK